MLSRAFLSESREIRLRRIESATEAWKTARRDNQKENSTAILDLDCQEVECNFMKCF